MKRKFSAVLSVMLCIAIMFTLTAVSAAAAQDADAYVIGSADELNAFSAAVAGGDDFSGKVVVLSADITADEDFSPIGNKENPFAGTFDGNSHTVSGVFAECDYAGFFGYTKDAVISELTVSGDFFAAEYAGGIVAYGENTVIVGCVNDACVYADYYTGGIAGYLTGEIIDCKTTSTPAIIGYEAHTGGILGYGAADITGCANNAYIQGIRNVGGIAGYSTGDITYCTNTVRIEAGANNCGGIAGYAAGDISFSKNAGAVAGTGKTGGIAGILSGASIIECLNSGSVTATGEYAGGIAGYITDAAISDCACVASVFSSSDFAAGIFGSSSVSVVSRCVFTSTATSLNSTEAAIGGVTGGTVTACYYNSENSSKAFVTGNVSSGASGITSAEIAAASSYEGWDFNDVWAINEVHASYPLLRNAGFHTLSVVGEAMPSCTENGYRSEFCSVCHEEINTVLEATGHDYKIVSIRYPSCAAAGYTDTVCTVCGDAISETVEALPHTDADGNKTCDECGKDLSVNEPAAKKSFFQKIIDFFSGIFEWLKNLFN